MDAVEFDVQFAADGHPMVFHDETMARMGGVAMKISDHPEAVLKCLDIGFLHGEQHRGLRVPSVADVARLVPPAVELHVELKDYAPISEREMDALMDVLERHGGLARVILSSPHEDQLSEISGRSPDLRVALLLFGDVRSPTDAVRRAAFLGCHAVNPNHELIDRDLVVVCHRHKMKVFAFTVNERGTMRKLEKMGVDGFFTDYPDQIRGASS